RGLAGFIGCGQLGYERVGASLQRRLEGVRGREIEGTGSADDDHLALAIDGDAIARVEAFAAYKRAIEQLAINIVRFVWRRKLDHEGIRAARVEVTEGIAGRREIKGIGLAGEINVPVRVQGDAVPLIPAGAVEAAQQGGIEQRGR